MEYSKTSVEAKKAARDIQRTKQILNIQTEIKKLQDRVEYFNNLNQNVEKTILRAEYNIKMAETTENPDLEDIKKKENECIKNETSNLDYCKENIDKLNEEIEAKNKEIAEVQDGTFKVNFERMNELAKTLIEKNVTNKFVNEEYKETN